MAVELRRERRRKKWNNNNKTGKWVRWESKRRGKWEKRRGDRWSTMAFQRRLVNRIVDSEGWVSVVREKERRKEEGKKKERKKEWERACTISKSRLSVESYALVAAEEKAEIVNHMQLKSTRLLEC